MFQDRQRVSRVLAACFHGSCSVFSEVHATCFYGSPQNVLGLPATQFWGRSSLGDLPQNKLQVWSGLVLKVPCGSFH